MRLAIIIRGVSYGDYISSISQSQTRTSYLDFIDDFKKLVVDELKIIGYSHIDIFLITYHSDMPQDKIIADYGAVDAHFSELQYHIAFNIYSVITKQYHQGYVMACNYAEKHGFEYDAFLFTRFDIRLKKPLTQFRVDPTKLNISFNAENMGICDDSFWLVPKQHMPLLLKGLQHPMNGECMSHEILRHLINYANMPEEQWLNFMIDGFYWCHSTPFYHLRYGS